jgi:hypothetical protein
MVLLPFPGAVVTDAYPIVGEDLANFVSITGFHRINPVVFNLLDCFRHARAFGRWRLGLREGWPNAG